MLFYADPGAIIRNEQAAEIERELKNVTCVNIGPGLHYLQEDNPQLIGEELRS